MSVVTTTGFRVAALLPAPFALSDYEPFKPLGASMFGTALVEDGSDATRNDLVKALRQAFIAGATAGYAPVPRTQAVFFDMDATVIVEESLVELATHAGHGARVLEVTERAMRGEIDFAESLHERVALLKGTSADVVKMVADRLTLNRGIQPFVAFCREVGVPTFMVSGGFTVLAEAIQKKVGFNDIHANILGIAHGKLTGKVDGPIVDAVEKRRYFLETCKSHGIDPKQATAVGDGANDLPMMAAAGMAVGFKPKPVLLPHIHALNAVGNHAFLGPLLFGRDIAILRRSKR